MSVESIVFNGTEVALVVRSTKTVTDGVEFFTRDEETLQLGMFGYRDGAVVEPHIHTIRERTITETHEIVFMQKGGMDVGFYDESGEKLGNVILNQGDAVLLLRGGHGFTAIGDVQVLEIKQGPYDGVNLDKTPLA